MGSPKVQIEVQDENRKQYIENQDIENLIREFRLHSQTTEKLVEIYERMEKMITERLENQYERMRQLDRREVELEFREKGCKDQ